MLRLVAGFLLGAPLQHSLYGSLQGTQGEQLPSAPLRAPGEGPVSTTAGSAANSSSDSDSGSRPASLYAVSSSEAAVLWKAGGWGKR